MVLLLISYEIILENRNLTHYYRYHVGQKYESTSIIDNVKKNIQFMTFNMLYNVYIDSYEFFFLLNFS